ncbi:radical SAM protein [Candidatus Woesearchaeota archaeon]|nr:radical SAM protein [Candidatus Woesearchaeota archaeon]
MILLMVNDKKECNRSCNHCYLPYQGKRSAEETVELVRQLKEQGELVSLAGSEVLTDLGYLEAYQKASQKYILTNGILLLEHPEIYDKLHEQGIKEVRISAHFGIEKMLGSVPESDVATVIEEAKNEGLKVQITTTITPENYRLVESMCDQSKYMNADKLEFIRYVKAGSARREQRRMLTAEERAEFFELVVEAREGFDKSDLEIAIHGNFGPREGSRGERLAKFNRYCPAGTFLFVVDPNNIVYGCPFLMDFPIGKLVEGKVEVEKELCGGKRDKCLTDYLLS